MDKETMTVFNMTLKVIADLPDGYKLALHKNGPVIANKSSIWALELAAGRNPKDFDEPELPHDVRKAAIRRYVEITFKMFQD